MIGTRVKAPLPFFNEIAPIDTLDGALSWSEHASDPRSSLSAKHLLLRFLWKDRRCHPVRAVDDADGPGGGSITTPDFADHITQLPHLYLVPSLTARHALLKSFRILQL